MNTNRQGMMLIETVAALSAGSILMIAAIGVIHQSMAWSRRAQVRNELQSSLERLARQWRIDTHGSERLELLSADHVQLVGRTGERTQYRWQSPNLIREQYAASSPEANPIHREQFDLSDDCKPGFEQIDAPKRGRLVIVRPGPVADEDRIELEISGVIDRWSFGGSE